MLVFYYYLAASYTVVVTKGISQTIRANMWWLQSGHSGGSYRIPPHATNEAAAHLSNFCHNQSEANAIRYLYNACDKDTDDYSCSPQ